MAAKHAWQVREGMQLEKMDAYSGFQTVQSVYVEDGMIQIQTDQTTWLFKHDELVKFPRRPDGDNKVWGIGGEVINPWDLCIGDIIPSKNGWVDEAGNQVDPNEVLGTGFVLCSVTYSSVGQIMTVKRIGSEEIHSTTRQLLITWRCETLYGKGTVEVQDTGPSDRQPRKGTNTSGYYRSNKDNSRVRFRIKGSSGRPPTDSIDPPHRISDWSEWELMDNQRRHPGDPRR